MRSTAEAHKEGSGGALVFSEIERSSRKHQSPQQGRKGAPIVLMMLAYVGRARARGSGGQADPRRMALNVPNILVPYFYTILSYRQTIFVF